MEYNYIDNCMMIFNDHIREKSEAENVIRHLLKLLYRKDCDFFDVIEGFEPQGIPDLLEFDDDIASIMDEVLIQNDDLDTPTEIYVTTNEEKVKLLDSWDENFTVKPKTKFIVYNKSAKKARVLEKQ